MQTNYAIKAVIFDIDGVLINGEQFSTQLARDYGITKEKTLPFFTVDFQKCLVGKADLKEELQKHIKLWGWKQSIDDLLLYWFNAETQLDRELFAYIESLKGKGIHVYVATNQERYRTAFLWEELGFSKIFKEIFSSAHVGHRKHEQIFFEKIIQRMPPEIKKSNIILLDDTEKNIASAKTFGIHAELYTTFDAFLKTMEKYNV